MGTFGRRRIPRRGTESSREWRGESRWLKLVTSWEDVVEELPAVIRAEPLAVETTNPQGASIACGTGALAGREDFLEGDAVTREKRRRKSSGIHGSFSGNR